MMRTLGWIIFCIPTGLMALNNKVRLNLEPHGHIILQRTLNPNKHYDPDMEIPRNYRGVISLEKDISGEYTMGCYKRNARRPYGLYIFSRDGKHMNGNPIDYNFRIKTRGLVHWNARERLPLPQIIGSPLDGVKMTKSVYMAAREFCDMISVLHMDLMADIDRNFVSETIFVDV